MENYILEKKSTEEQRKARLEEIKATIQSLKLDNISTFFGRKEINELPDILSATELVDNIIQGIYNDGQGILVSTGRRLVFVDKGLLYGIRVEDFPLDKITTIQYETG
ncbi:MAG: PH domain-containing protein [Bacteroidota bacterium]